MIKWKEPNYPGDAVRMIMLVRNDEIGDIRIQHHGATGLKVCAFLPGVTECPPGDTPKTWPEESEWVTSEDAANRLFAQYEAKARANGWRDWRRE